MRDTTIFSMIFPMLPQLEFTSYSFPCITHFILFLLRCSLGVLQFFPVSLRRYTVRSNAPGTSLRSRWYRRNLQQLQRGSRGSRLSYPLHPWFLGLSSSLSLRDSTSSRSQMAVAICRCKVHDGGKPLMREWYGAPMRNTGHAWIFKGTG